MNPEEKLRAVVLGGWLVSRLGELKMHLHGPSISHTSVKYVDKGDLYPFNN